MSDNNRGIVIDVGFKGQWQDFIRDIEKNFEKIDFEKYLNLDKSFDKQVKEVRGKLEDLRKEIDTAINGKLPNNPVKAFSDLNKSVSSLSSIVLSLAKNIPEADKYTAEINDITRNMNGLSESAQNAADIVSKLGESSGGNLQFKQQIEQLKDMYMMLERVNVEYDKSFGTSKNKHGNSPYTKEDYDTAINDIKGYYVAFSELNDKIENMSFNPESFNDAEINRTNAALLKTATDLSRIIASFEKIGGDLSKVELEPNFYANDFIAELDDVVADVVENIAQAKSKIQAQFTELGGVGDLSDLFKKSTAKTESIKIPISIADGSRAKLLHDAISLVDSVQNGLYDHPLTVEVHLASQFQTKASQALFKEITNEIDKIQDGQITEKLQGLLDKMNTSVENAVMFNVYLNTQNATNQIRHFTSEIKDQVRDIQKILTINPEFTITEETKAKLQDLISNISKDFTIELQVQPSTEDGNGNLLTSLNSIYELIESLEAAFIAEGKAVDFVTGKEIRDLGAIERNVNFVTDAIRNNTAEFIANGKQVDRVIGKEVSGLLKLIDVIKDVRSTLQEITQNQADTISVDNNGLSQSITDVLGLGIDTAKTSPLMDQYRKLGQDSIDSYSLGVVDKADELSKAINKVLSGGLTSVKTNGKNVANLSSLLTTLRGTITSLGGDKSDEKIQKVANNLAKLSDSLSSLNVKEAPILTDLKEILDRGKELESLASVLKSTKKQIEATGKAVNEQNKLQQAQANIRDYADEIRKAATTALPSGSTVMSQSIEATKDGLVEVSTLIKNLNGEYTRYIQTSTNGQDIQTKKIEDGTASVLKQAKIVERLQALFNSPELKSIGQITPGNTAEWSQLIDLMDSFGIKLNDVSKIIQTVDHGVESFQIFNTDGTMRTTLGMNSEDILYEKNSIIDLTNTIKQFQDIFENLPKLFTRTFKDGGVSVNVFTEQFSKLFELFKKLQSFNDLGLDINIEEYQNKLLVLQKTLTEALDIDSSNNTAEFQEEITNITSAIKVLFENVFKYSQITEDELQDLTSLLSSELIPQLDVIKDKENKTTNDKQVANLLKTIRTELNKNSAMAKTYKNQLIEYETELSSGSKLTVNRIDEIKAAVMLLQSEIQKSGKLGKTVFEKIGNAVSTNLIQFVARYLSIQDIIRYTRYVLTTIKDLDTALVDLKKTTSMTGQELNEFYYDANDVAKEMGVTTKAIIEQAAAWSRLGYSSKEAATEMAALSSQFASISPGMTTDSAQTGLVSIMKAWNVDVNNVKRDIMDNINVLGNKFAETNEDIINGMERAGATLATIGMSMQDSFALFTGAQEVIQNAETVGTALKTLSLRIRGYDEETEQLSDDVVAATGEVADLTKVASNNFAGVSLWADAEQTKYRSLKDYLKDISAIWNEIDAGSQTKLLENLFGKRGASVGSAILSNFSQVEKAITEMELAAGSSDREMETIRQSIEFKLNQLKETWTGFFQDLLSREDFGQLIDSLINASNSIQGAIEGLTPAVTGLINVLSPFIELIGKLVGSMGEATPIVSAFALAFTKSLIRKNKDTDVVGTLASAGISKLKKPIKEAINYQKQLQLTMRANGVTAKEASAILSKYAAANGAVATSGKAMLAAIGPQLLVIAGITAAVGLGIAAFNKWNVTVEETQKDIDDTNSKISDLKSEIAELENIDYRNASQQLRLNNLREELSLQEKILDVETKRNARERTKSEVSDLFDKDNLSTQLKIAQDFKKGSAADYLGNLKLKRDKYNNITDSMPTYLEALQNGQISQNTFDKQTNKQAKALEDYENAVLDASEALLTYKTNLNEIEEMMQNGSISRETGEKLIKGYQGVINQIEDDIVNAQKEIGTFDYSEAFNGIFGTAKFDKYKDLLVETVSAGNQIDLSKYNGLAEALDEASLSASELYSWIMNIADPKHSESEKILAKYGLDKEGQARSQENVSKLKDLGWLNQYGTLTDEALQFNAEIHEKYPYANVDTFEDWIYWMQKVASEKPVEIDTEFNVAKFSKMVDEIDNLQSLYEKFRSNVDKKEPISIDVSDVEKLRETWGELENFNEFELIVTSDTSSVEQVQNAFDGIVTDYVNAQFASKGLNEQTKEMVKSQLELAGLTSESVEPYVEQMYEMGNAQKFITDGSYDLANATAEDVAQLFNEAQAAGFAEQGLVAAAAAEIIFANNDLNADEKINQLKNIAAAAFGAAAALELEQMTSNNGYDHSYTVDPAEAWSRILNKYSNLSLNLDFDPTSAAKSGGSAGKEAGDAYVEAFEKELKQLDELKDAGVISEKEYLDRLKALYVKYFAGNTKYAKQFYQYQKQYLEGMKGLYQNAISGAKTVLNFQIKQLEKAKDQAIKILEEERDAAKKPIQAQIDALEDQRKALERANEARERDMELQKAQYNLARALAQRTKLIYKDGQMVYQTDTTEIRNTKDELDDAIYNKKVGELDDRIEDLNDKLDDIDKYYDELIKDTEEMYDAQIEGLQNILDMWEEFEAKLELADALDALGEFGFTMEDVLSGSPALFESLTNGLIGVTAALEGNGQALATAFGKSVEDISGYSDAILGYDDATKTWLDTLNGADMSGINTALDGVTTAAGNVANAISGNGGSGNGNTNNGIGGSTDNGQQGQGSSSTGSITSAIDDLDQKKLETIKSEFAGEDEESLLGAVNKVTEAIGGGEEGGDKKPSGDKAEAGSLTEAITMLPTMAEEPMTTTISFFTTLRDQIEMCIQYVTRLIDKIAELPDELPGGGNELGGNANIFTGKGYFASKLGGGVAYAGGKNNTLVGEEGYEIVAHRNGSWEMIGSHGAEFTNKVKSGDVVFNHAQSKSLLEKGKIPTRGKAYAGGKLPEGFSPLSTDELSAFRNISGQFDIANQKLFNLDKNVGTLVSKTTNNNHVFNIQNKFECNGVTADQVQKQIEDNFTGILNRALQQAYTR